MINMFIKRSLMRACFLNSAEQERRCFFLRNSRTSAYSTRIHCQSIFMLHGKSYLHDLPFGKPDLHASPLASHLPANDVCRFDNAAHPGVEILSYLQSPRLGLPILIVAPASTNNVCHRGTKSSVEQSCDRCDHHKCISDEDLPPQAH